jgi:protein-disulfide isomerase
MQAPTLRIRDDDHARGPADAPLVLVMYGDYDCPHTRASTAVVKQLEQALHPHSVRFVFRHFPLRHMHANAQLLSEVAESAGRLGHFWATHDRLMSHARMTSAALMEDLAKSQVSMSDLEPLLGSPDIRDRIERDVEEGKALRVHSTPTFFFNGVLHDGHYDLETLKGRAAAALEHARVDAR